MRIVKFAELLQQPVGTLFSPCIPLVFNDLCIFLGRFGESDKDFVYDSLLGPDMGYPERVANAHDAFGDSSIKVGIDLYGSQRWGSYDEDATFAVYSTEEQTAFIARLQHGLSQRLGNALPQFPEHLITVVSPNADIVEHSTTIIKGLFQNAVVIGSVRVED